MSSSDSDRSTADSLEARLWRLESLESIRRLVQAYSLSVDEHAFDTIGNGFAKNARYRSEDGLIDVHGREAITDYFRHRMAKLGPTCHVTHDHVIDLDPEDATHAEGKLVSHAEVVVDGVPMAVCLRYRDRYVVEASRWCFEERCMQFMYYCPIEEYPAILKSRHRKIMGGERRPADVPEALKGWSGQVPEPS